MIFVAAPQLPIVPNLAGVALGAAGADPRGAQIIAGVQSAVNPALLQANVAAANSGSAMSDIASSVNNVGLGLKEVGGWGAGTAIGLGQAAAQGAGGAVTGGIAGLTDSLSRGDIFGGLIKGITGAIKGGTSGIVNGAPTGFVSGLGGTLSG